LSPELLIAGAQFVEGLRTLGLRHVGAFWLHDIPRGGMRFGLVVPALEFADMTRFHRLLVKAYRRSALPQAIDPLMVEVFDTHAWFAAELRKHMPELERGPLIPSVRIKGTSLGGEEVEVPLSPGNERSMMVIGDYGVSVEWIYQAWWTTSNERELRHEFRAFERAVGALRSAA